MEKRPEEAFRPALTMPVSEISIFTKVPVIGFRETLCNMLFENALLFDF